MLTMKYLTPSAIAFTLLATSLQAYSAAIPTSQSQVHAPSLAAEGPPQISEDGKPRQEGALGHHVSRELGATHYARRDGHSGEHVDPKGSQVGRRDVDGYSGSEYLGRRSLGYLESRTLEKRAGVGDSAKLQLGTEVKPNPPTPDPAQIVPHYPEVHNPAHRLHKDDMKALAPYGVTFTHQPPKSPPNAPDQRLPKPDLDSFVVGGMMFPHPPKSGRPAKEADSRPKAGPESLNLYGMRFPHPPKSRRPAEEAKLKADPESFDPSVRSPPLPKSKPPAKAQPVKAPPAKAPPAKALPAEAPPAKARLAKASPKYSFFPNITPPGNQNQRRPQVASSAGGRKGLSAKAPPLGGERREGLLDGMVRGLQRQH